MTMLQITLLILGVLLIVAVVLSKWLERRGSDARSARWTPPPTGQGRAGLPLGDQMDIFGASAGEFDEFGVGRPRKVGTVGERQASDAAADASSPAAVSAAEPASSSRRKPPLMGKASAAKPGDAPSPAASGLLRRPSIAPTAPAPAAAEPEPEPSAASPSSKTEATASGSSEAPPPSATPEATANAPDLVVVLFVAERQGRHLPGARIHAALQAQGLKATPDKIYQRAEGDDVWFSVASLIKPGALDPADAAKFSAPGLTLYLTVPGALNPAAALEDLLITSDRLAGALDADVFDQERQPLSPATRSALRAKVAALARN